MVKVRKIPVIVDAIQIDTEMYIDTLEGVMKASPGDWIVTGVDGEKYPVKQLFACGGTDAVWQDMITCGVLEYAVLMLQSFPG